MAKLNHEASSGLDPKRIRCQKEGDYLERVPHVIDHFRHAQEPLNSRASFELSASLYVEIQFSAALSTQRDQVL